MSDYLLRIKLCHLWNEVIYLIQEASENIISDWNLPIVEKQLYPRP